jgi:hypothetical protein
MRAIADFTIDFQSQHYGEESTLARAILSDLIKQLGLKDQGSFVMSDTSGQVAGWSFGKLFLSLEFVQKLYDGNSYEIDRSFLGDKFIAWVNKLLVDKGCKTLVLKAADEMEILADSLVADQLVLIVI